MHIRKGVKLLEEREGQGDLVQRQHEYILAIRLALQKGEILVPGRVTAEVHGCAASPEDIDILHMPA